MPATRTSQAKRELAASYIGHWVGRLKNGQPQGQRHLIESAVNASVETKCGKRMVAGVLVTPSDPEQGGTGMAIDAYLPDTMARCKTCVSKAAPGEIPGHDDETPFPTPGETTGMTSQPT